jgi:hypothetical protein
MLSKFTNFDTSFRLLSYFSVLCGFISLWVSGTFGIVISSAFLILFVLAWFLEDSGWQISERAGTILIVLALPVFYVAVKMQLFGFSSSESMIAGTLSRLILSLTLIKLLQKKAERDWIFLYLMSFFEVLLAAGLSISALYLGSFILYLLVTICAVIAFEIRKTSKDVQDKISAQPETKIAKTDASGRIFSFSRLPLTSFLLIFFIVALALPMFFLIPRVGGAGFGANQNSVSTYTGFSDSVNLGEIGRIQQNEQVVMRVRLEKSDSNLNYIRWRGVALDKFDKKNWQKTKFEPKEILQKDETGFFRIPLTSTRSNLVVQTVYLEPLDSPILFSLSRPSVIQANFSILFKDSDGSLTFPSRNNFERLSYKVLSDTSLPSQRDLRSDNSLYGKDAERYLQLPENMDPRIARLAADLTKSANNRLDKAKTIEQYLQTQFGYTLELKSGGEEPLADFLFNIREGHCEYFATAMAVMLRTQGIATRVVNGFQAGEYNETADVYVVKQRNAHSWVEVYFPKENAWVPFDPTPAAGQNLESNASSGIIGTFNNYIEALETFWIQYFVAYDNHEQRSLMRSVRNGLVDFQTNASSWLSEKQNEFSDWWKEARGDKGFETSAKAIGYGIAYIVAFVLGIFVLIFLYRRIIKLQIWQNAFAWLRRKNEATIIEFYERMQKVLASKGFVRAPHQTPLEFAFALNMPEAVKITEKYNRVRFGEKNLSNDEAKEIENWLDRLEKNHQ